MSLKGRVEDLGVAELLYMVGISKRSGLLHVDGRDGEHELLFRGGRIVAARDRKAPGSLQDLLVRRNVVDQTHLSVLERQAAREGQPLADLLAAEGLLTGGALDQYLRQELERAVDASLALREGDFSFELVDDADPSVLERFGGLVLEEGQDPARIPAVAERSAGAGLGDLGGMGLPRSEAGRRAELLLDDSKISLPVLPPSAARSEATDASSAEEDSAEGRPHALLAVGWTELGRRLQSLLETHHVTVLRPRSVLEAAERAMRLVAAGAPVTLVADTTLTALPGIELLARVKLAERGARVLLLLDPRGTPAQLAARRERASRLGATHVLLLPPGTRDDDAELAAGELAELIEPAPPPAVEDIHRLAQEAEPAPDWPEGAAETGESGALLPSLPLESQDARLASLLRELVASKASAELALELLEVASEYAARATLWVKTRGGEDVRAFGVSAEDPAAHARLARSLPRLRLPAGDADMPCQCLRDGKSRRVPAALAGAGLTVALDEPVATEVAGLPLLGPEGPVACLVLDDAGQAGRLASLGALERFLAGLAGSLAAALARDARRSEARALRAGS